MALAERKELQSNQPKTAGHKAGQVQQSQDGLTRDKKRAGGFGGGFRYRVGVASHEGKTEPPEGVVTFAGAAGSRIAAEEVRRQCVRDHQRRNSKPMGHFARRNVPGFGAGASGIRRGRGSGFSGAVGGGSCWRHRSRAPGLVPTGGETGREDIVVHKYGAGKRSMDAANQSLYVIKAALALHNPRG